MPRPADLPQTPEVSTPPPKVLANALGVASIGLGIPMTVVPGRFLAAIGVEENAESRAWALAVGAREYAAAAALLVLRRRRFGTWARVAGDVMDASLLLAAHRNSARDEVRLRVALVAASGILALDLFAAIQQGREVAPKGTGGPADETTPPKDKSGPTRVKKALTVRMGEEELRRRFREFEWSQFDPAELEAAGDVRFARAPNNQGTEIHLDHEPGTGTVRATAAKLVGQAPDQVIGDELRRFKAICETGEFPRSEKTPEGPSSRRYLKQQPAQPVGGSS